MKPLEELAEEVESGDLIRVNFMRGDYVGYVWFCPKEEGTTAAITEEDSMTTKYTTFVLCSSLDDVKTWEPDNKKRILENIKGQLAYKKNNDIILCGLNPYSMTDDRLDKVQFIGINLKEGKIGEMEIIGYEILKKYKGEHELE